MKLRDARLCADCDEVYKAKGLYARCPSCGSESFALISRWVPTLHEFEKWIDNRTHEVKAYKNKGWGCCHIRHPHLTKGDKI